MTFILLLAWHPAVAYARQSQRRKDYRLLSYATVDMAGGANDMQTQCGKAASGGKA